MPPMPPEELRSLLIAEHYVTEEDAQKAMDFAAEHGGDLEAALLNLGILTPELLGQALAEKFGVPFVNLAATPPTHEQVALIPEDVARAFRVVVVRRDAERVVVATDSPQEPGMTAALAPLFPNLQLQVSYAAPRGIDSALALYRAALDERLKQAIASTTAAPQLIDALVEEALQQRASDIHLEPNVAEVAVRFRVDGVLKHAGSFPRAQYENVLNRLKVAAQLRTDEHAAAQDGSLHAEHGADGRRVDLRLSIVPTVTGEKVVLRILASYLGTFSLAGLDLSPRDQDLLVAASAKPFGMILVVGPTGSGKTTTLYALLQSLNTPGVNITTIEDPVEYRMEGVNQIQVNTETELTFARGLRSIVRQDPDIVLVGEIRDEETAEIAVNAALTGHLMLSTFHANDAATAIPRLLEMGVEPFLVASTIELVVAKRLARRICDQCRSRDGERAIGTRTVTLYKGKGCDACGGTGFRGRVGIYEMIPTTPALQQLILQRPSAPAIWEAAQASGSRTFYEDGLDKVAAGLTTLDELDRVAPASRPHA